MISSTATSTALAFFIVFWIICIDMCYATMDSQDDAAAGVKTLAVMLKPFVHFCLSLLAGGEMLIQNSLDSCGSQSRYRISQQLQKVGRNRDNYEAHLHRSGKFPISKVSEKTRPQFSNRTASNPMQIKYFPILISFHLQIPSFPIPYLLSRPNFQTV